ncbi:lymphocyte-specific protein 1 isoform X1 [Rana temporaria]|uniref:lymphocyte-specific protein 1 isoform X1 n=1 Tax=Rana temporaria TaxID=8407 RepID=UPI001AAD1829|nr:lymphocyte-specific protein 1 isoform X1 [Rana temporaria]
MSDNEEPQREEGCEEQMFQERLEETERLTTQWSVEDEEETARERRRRERQQQLGGEGQSPDDLDDENSTQTDNHVGLKPAGPWETEEDEGFSDWSQKLVQRKLRGAAQAAEEQEEPRFTDGEQTEQTRATEETHTYNTEAQVEEEDEGTTRNEEVEANDEPELCTEETEIISSSQWETREIIEDYRPPSPRVPEKESEEQEDEEGGYMLARHQVQIEGYQDRCVTDEVETRRRSVSSDGEEGDGSITVKVTERTEILNRSIQKSNSIKRSEPPLPIHKIDDRLELYTHAIETSAKPGRLVRQPSLEMLSPTDPVANIKNRWEAGDITAASKAATCKDTEGINIGVSDMINQWGKGKSEPDGQTSPPKLTEVKPGDVLSKKSLWEQGSKPGQMDKNATPSKKYKFVPTGHGKYEKVLMDEP